MFKHVVIEQFKPNSLGELEELAYELWLHMQSRGWAPYRAFVAREPEAGEPSLFDLGVLRSSLHPQRPLIIYEAVFETRAALETQLRDMRLDPKVARIIMAASELVDSAASRSYVVEEWLPSEATVAQVMTKRRTD